MYEDLCQVQAGELVVARRTVISMMLRGWEWEGISPLELSCTVCERDEMETFGTSMPQGQAALAFSVCCSVAPVSAVAAIRSFQGHFRTQDAGG